MNDKKTVNVYERLYRKLITDLDNKLTYPILGKDYYNEGNDVYSCNNFTIRDLKYEFDKMKRRLKISHIILLISTILWSIVFITLYFI